MAKEAADQRVCSFKSGHPHPLRRAEGCQFEGAPLYLTGEQTFCIFHLPLDAEISPQPLAAEGFGFAGSKRRWSTEENEDFSRYLKGLTSGARLAVRDLTGVVFPSDQFFRETSIVNGLIGECTFFKRSGSYAFIGTQFAGDHVSFQHGNFTAPTRFADAQFTAGAASFAYARFDADADFNGCVFPAKGTSFAHAVFAGPAVFRNSALRQLADFRRADFAATADFDGCSLPHGARFREAQFHGPARFAGPAEALTDRKAGNGPSEAIYDFTDSVFEQSVSFVGRSFGSLLDLGSAVFTLTPDFKGAALSAGAVFPPIENFRSRNAPEDEARYAVLKREADEIDSPEDREKFWMLEMASRAGRDSSGDAVESFARGVYATFGAYGSSVTRPVAWLAGLSLVAFPLLYFGIFLLTRPRPVHASLAEAFIFSLQQTFRPFEVWRDALLPARAAAAGAEFSGLLLALLGTLESLAVIPLAVMAIVALRRRLRMT